MLYFENLRKLFLIENFMFYGVKHYFFSTRMVFIFLSPTENNDVPLVFELRFAKVMVIKDTSINYMHETLLTVVLNSIN